MVIVLEETGVFRAARLPGETSHGPPMSPLVMRYALRDRLLSPPETDS